MPKIPDHDYTVAELDEQKLWSVVYTYEENNGEWFADTWNIEAKTIDGAIDTVAEWLFSRVESGELSAYEITNINVVRR